ncbi:MAG: putative thioredoxin [Pseudonocardiales bacterium]|jgi:putative thioredoxin|nr:putative thioredoxin [Pseudonocardiales bacterium]MDT4971678.1 putative thioredoxin [Pseudonocardiales bacterium]
MSGAVDLAAIQARAEAAARAAEAPAPSVGQYVVDITESTFQPEVLDRSFQLPVLVELSSARAAGSAQLSPLLERLARESGGSWMLAHIDVDANPRIAQALQVSAVPTVFAVINGQLLPGFQGVLPDAELREFVRAVLQAGQEAGLAGGTVPDGDGDVAPAQAVPEEPEDPRLVAAEDALEQGDYALAAQHYQEILDAEPANAQVAMALRQVRLFERVESLDPALAAAADATPDDLQAQLAAADLAFASNDATGAFDRLLALLARSGPEDRETIRERLLEYFELLGSDDPRVAPARRELARVLF